MYLICGIHLISVIHLLLGVAIFTNSSVVTEVVLITFRLVLAALTEPISCVAHGWDRISPVPVGSTILILGAGIIGNLWAAALHLQGHRKVVVSEPQEARRKLLEKLGW